MSIAVRYYSRSGNTRAVAQAIAEAAGVPAVSVDNAAAPLTEPADVLFIGGALYAYGLDDHLKQFLQTLTARDAKLAVVFSTSWLSKHAVVLIKKALAEAGIPTAEAFYYVKGMPNDAQKAAAAAFARPFLP